MISRGEQTLPSPKDMGLDQEKKSGPADFSATKEYLSEYLELNTPQETEQIRFMEASDLEGEYAEQLQYLDDERLTHSIIAIVPDQFWPAGKLGPSESNAKRNLILFRESYFTGEPDRPRDEIAWMLHELAHLSRYKNDPDGYQADSETLAIESVGSERSYPNNKVEQFTFTKQFEFLTKKGLSEDRILKLLEEYYNERDSLFFRQLLSQVV